MTLNQTLPQLNGIKYDRDRNRQTILKTSYKKLELEQVSIIIVLNYLKCNILTYEWVSLWVNNMIKLESKRVLFFEKNIYRSRPFLS